MGLLAGVRLLLSDSGKTFFIAYTGITDRQFYVTSPVYAILYDGLKWHIQRFDGRNGKM